MRRATTRSFLALAALCVMGTGAFYLGLTSQTYGQWRNLVTADRFDLVDFRGVPRARLGLSGGNQQYTYLYLMDSSGRNRVQVVIDPSNEVPKVQVLDVRGRVVGDMTSLLVSDSSAREPEIDHQRRRIRQSEIVNLQNQIDGLRIDLDRIASELEGLN